LIITNIEGGKPLRLCCLYLQGYCKRLSEVGKENASFHVRPFYQMAHGYLYSHESYQLV
jgi:hypothetical protein